MDYQSELEKIEKQASDAVILKAKEEQKKEQYTQERAKLLEELAALNIKEEDLVQTLTNLETEIEEGIEECKALLA